MTDDSRPLRILERLWSLRYASPGSLLSGLPLVPDMPERRVFEAFLAWREQDLDQAVTIGEGLVASDDLEPRWAARARGVLAATYADLGRFEDAVTCHLAEVELARTADDAISLARATHDLGSALHTREPARAADYYLEAIQLARRFREGLSLEDTRESCALEALAILNMQDLRYSHGVTSVPEVPGLPAAEKLALRGWPELAATIRAVRVVTALNADDEQGARELALALPDPESMRDVTAAGNVVLARARLMALDGQVEEGCALLAEIIERLPVRHRAPLQADLEELRRSAS